MALHPAIAGVYAAKVATLASLLADGHHPEALDAARALIEKVVCYPPEADDHPPGVKVIGDLAGLLRAAGGEQDNAANEPSGADPVLGLFVRSIKAGPRMQGLALL